VAGIYMASGVEGPTYVVDPRCSIRATVVEFNLKSHKNSRKLHNLVFKSTDKSGVIGDGDPVFIIFEGEIFGPQMPDPKLPEYFRKNYHPGWDANNYKTKLVVHSILDVRQLSLDHPCAATKDDKWPCYQHTAPTMTP